MGDSIFCGKGQQTGQEAGDVAGALDTHFCLVDEQHHVGEGVQGHVHRQLHGARVADAASGKQAGGRDSRVDAVREEGAATPPPPPPYPTPQPSHPNEQPLPVHRVTVNPFPSRMSVSRKMRKLEEKSSLAGKGRKADSGTGSKRSPDPC